MPFSVDTYLPAFLAIRQSLGATPLEMQQTLSAYLFGFAFMGLFHGALSDSFGRRPVLLFGIAVFALASVGCASARGIMTLIAFRALQGMSCGVGMIVGGALTRDLLDEAGARRLMSHVMMIAGVAPAVAPIVGGSLFVHLGWAFVFWFLALLGALLFVIAWRTLPESLPRAQRQPFRPRPLLEGYKQVGTSSRFLSLALAGGLPFNAIFIYIFSAPTVLGVHLRLAPAQFFWLFVPIVLGSMAGSFLGARLSGSLRGARQISLGYAIMSAAATLGALHASFFAPHAVISILPIGACAFGFSLLAPGVAVTALDLFPSRRGMASSLQLFISNLANGIVASLVSPLVMDSTKAMAWAAAGLCLAGCAAWVTSLPPAERR